MTENKSSEKKRLKIKYFYLLVLQIFSLNLWKKVLLDIYLSNGLIFQNTITSFKQLTLSGIFEVTQFTSFFKFLN